MSEEQQSEDRMEQSLEDMQAFSANMLRVAARSQQLINEFLLRQSHTGQMANMDPLNITGAFMDLAARMMANPQRLMEHQMQLWQDYFRLMQSTALRMMGEETDPVIDAKGDKRFRHEDWQIGRAHV